jgi:CPA2 family monovalent cation:H+ antiporter-2
MSHNLPLVTTLATALGMALLLGFLASRLRVPAIVGYLMAGVLIGPFTPGFVADTRIAAELAEIGIMLLMFGVGLHFSVEDLLRVRRITLPGASMQIVIAAALGYALAASWGWPVGAALVFGLSLSVASTVVLLRALEASGTLESMNGHITVGWVVVQDLAMILVLVLLPPLAHLLGGDSAGLALDQGDLLRTLTLTFAKVVAFIALMLIVGRRLFPMLLWQVARSGSRELFTLCVVAAAVSVAFIAARLFGVSFALGAFFAGMMMRESEFAHRAAQESLPLRDAFAVLFFVSVGMLFDPTILINEPLRVVAVLAVILVGTPLVSALLVLFFRYPLNTAITVGASLAQIGEFSFILSGLGNKLGLLPAQGQDLILAGALISIAVNPLMFKAVAPLLRIIRARSALARSLERRVDPLAELPMSTHERFLSGQVVLVGYGRVGRRVAAMLAEHSIPFVVAEQNREIVERLRRDGGAAVCGDAAEPAVLIQAHIARASMLVIALSNASSTFNVRAINTTARLLNPSIETVVRTHSEEEAQMLEQEKVGTVFFGEGELARAIGRHALARYGKAT